jgi:hypothetical protein
MRSFNAWEPILPCTVARVKRNAELRAEGIPDFADASSGLRLLHSYRTRVPAVVSQWSGLSDFGSGASFAPIVTPIGVPGGQIAT